MNTIAQIGTPLLRQRPFNDISLSFRQLAKFEVLKGNEKGQIPTDFQLFA